MIPLRDIGRGKEKGDGKEEGGDAPLRVSVCVCVCVCARTLACELTAACSRWISRQRLNERHKDTSRFGDIFHESWTTWWLLNNTWRRSHWYFRTIKDGTRHLAVWPRAVTLFVLRPVAHARRRRKTRAPLSSVCYAVMSSFVMHWIMDETGTKSSDNALVPAKFHGNKAHLHIILRHIHIITRLCLLIYIRTYIYMNIYIFHTYTHSRLYASAHTHIHAHTCAYTRATRAYTLTAHTAHMHAHTKHTHNTHTHTHTRITPLTSIIRLKF